MKKAFCKVDIIPLAAVAIFGMLASILTEKPQVN